MNTRRSAVFRDAGRDRLERFFSPPGQHHARAFLGERKRSGLADSASRPVTHATLPVNRCIFASPSDMVSPGVVLLNGIGLRRERA